MRIDPRLAAAEAQLDARNPAAALAALDALIGGGALSRADRRAALLLRSRAHEDRRNLLAAIADVEAALALEPGDPRAYNALGLLRADSGDASGACAAFARATELDPRYARAWNNLGNALRGAGRTGEAAAAVQRAVAIQPDYALAWANLGVMQRELGDDEAAAKSLERALGLKPDLRAALLALGGIARTRGDIDRAATLYTQAARQAPGDAMTLLQLAGTLAERDDLVPARQAYADARARQPGLLRAAFGEVLTLPMVYRDATEVAAARARYAEGIARLEAEIPPLARGRTFAGIVDDLRWSNFLLAYQSEDDRELQRRFDGIVGGAIEVAAPEWRAPLPRRAGAGPRIRIGFASSFFTDGTVGMYFRRWITGLDRARFEIIVYHLRRGMTPFAAGLAPHVDALRTFEGAALLPSTVAPAIRADDLDVLVYPELGMDATTFVLGALRLAPVQCAAWGHPVTTGHATIDAFFTCGPMEPPGAEAHYTERLLPLPGIGTDYAAATPPAGATRARFGLPEDVPLLLCPQSLFKIHPDNDRLFARVLAAAPQARLVLFEGRHPALTAKYRARLAAACAAEGVGLDARLVVLRQCSHPEYLAINTVCDAMLDTLRWSGGNTSLDALACTLPIVTMPGRFMRGRQSAAMLALGGCEALVARDADDYVRIAARLASDREWRDAMRGRVRDGAPRVFGDPAPVRAFAAAVEALVRDAPVPERG